MNSKIIIKSFQKAHFDSFFGKISINQYVFLLCIVLLTGTTDAVHPRKSLERKEVIAESRCCPGDDFVSL